MMFHWQNLNDRIPVGEKYVKGWPKSGRCWLHVGRKTLRFEWSLGPHIGAHLEIDPCNSEITAYFGPLFGGFYLSLSGVRLPGTRQRTTGFNCYDWRVSTYVLADRNSWSSSDPLWQQWSFDIKDVVLGRRTHVRDVLEPLRETWIPLPEGPYRATVEVLRQTWTRPRWPLWPCTIRQVAYDIKIPTGIPFSGKGENSWDLGEDGLFGIAPRAASEADAIGQVVASVLTYRKKRGDGMLRPWPMTPAQREVEMEKHSRLRADSAEEQS